MVGRRLALLLAVALGPAGCGDASGPGEGARFFASVSAGGQHACAVSIAGDGYCWGRGATGELGDGRGGNSVSPVRLARRIALTEISAGLHHTCAVTVERALYCWGWNRYGQLGGGGTADQGVPVAIGDVAFAHVSSGWTHTCAVTPAGQAYCWGQNSQGQLGDGSTTDRTRPTAVAGGLELVAVTAGAFHTCGLARDGAAYCWGLNQLGQLGTGRTTPELHPAPVAGGVHFTAISAGYTHTCGLSADGQAYCWGSNGAGELGNGTRSDNASLAGSSTPVLVDQRVFGGIAFTAVAAGLEHTCGASTDARIFCWGRGVEGQLGDARQLDRVTPHPAIADDGAQFAAVSAGAGPFTCGVSRGNGVYCWGRGDSGELGNPTTSSSATPIRIQPTP
ncbi:MAG TPA: hypothetical protein VFQ38_17475 [Longimicrobiales bacterium]|nr:hypothetical protein [Longimicrobiales bacterium]